MGKEKSKYLPRKSDSKFLATCCHWSSWSGELGSVVQEAKSFTFKEESNSRKDWFYRPHYCVSLLPVDQRAKNKFWSNRWLLVVGSLLSLCLTLSKFHYWGGVTCNSLLKWATFNIVMFNNIEELTLSHGFFSSVSMDEIINDFVMK